MSTYHRSTGGPLHSRSSRRIFSAFHSLKSALLAARTCGALYPRLSLLAALGVAVGVCTPALAQPFYAMKDIGTLSGADSYGIDINRHGKMTGNSMLPGRRDSACLRLFARPDDGPGRVDGERAAVLRSTPRAKSPASTTTIICSMPCCTPAARSSILARWAAVGNSRTARFTGFSSRPSWNPAPSARL